MGHSPDEPSIWRSLLLPDGVYRAGIGDTAAISEPLESMPQLQDHASAFPPAEPREYYLARISATGQLPIFRAWDSVGRPNRVVVLSSLDDPGVALLSADGRDDWESTSYEVRKVSSTAKSARVFLGSSALSRLALLRGQQVVLTVIGEFVVLSNPGWVPIWDYWCSIADERSQSRSPQPRGKGTR